MGGCLGQDSFPNANMLVCSPAWPAAAALRVPLQAPLGALRLTWEAVRPWVSPGDLKATNIWGDQPPVLPVFLPILLPHLDPSKEMQYPNHSAESLHPVSSSAKLCHLSPFLAFPVLNLATPGAGPELGGPSQRTPCSTPHGTPELRLLASDICPLASAPSGPRRCASCRTQRTPLWRDAEDGTPLCNACGIRSAEWRSWGGDANQPVLSQHGVFHLWGKMGFFVAVSIPLLHPECWFLVLPLQV